MSCPVKFPVSEQENAPAKTVSIWLKNLITCAACAASAASRRRPSLRRKGTKILVLPQVHGQRPGLSQNAHYNFCYPCSHLPPKYPYMKNTIHCTRLTTFFGKNIIVLASGKTSAIIGHRLDHTCVVMASEHHARTTTKAPVAAVLGPK